MNIVISNLDLYKQPITLPIESRSKYSTKLGFIVSLITMILFLLHLYLESYEIFDRKHPTILSIKQDINSYNTSLEVSSATVNFFITIAKNFKTENFLLDYFEINTMFITSWGKNAKWPIKYTNCTEDDFERLRAIGWDDPIDTRNIMLCPRIDFRLPLYNKFSFRFSYGARECNNPAKGCIRDEDLYKKLNNGTYKLDTYLTIIDNKLDLLNSNNPLSYAIKTIKTGFKTILNVELEGIEVKTQSFLSFNYDTESQFKIQKTEVDDHSDPFFTDIFGYEIYYFPQDTNTHYRSYKTFNSAFASCFALFRLYTWLFGVLLKHYYEYNINNIIINKNFDYGRVIDKNKEERKRMKPVDYNFSDLRVIVSNKESILQDSNAKDINQPRRLTLRSVYGKVSLCRLLFCRLRNDTKAFYDNALLFIKRQLSVEQVLYGLVEQCRLNNYLIENDIVLRENNPYKYMLEDRFKIENENLSIDDALFSGGDRDNLRDDIGN
jgi:hypothetical protein